MDVYREAACVHLHDQMLMITDDPFTHGTDNGWMDERPEYSVPPSLQKVLVSILSQASGMVPTKNDRWDYELGINRSYVVFPDRSPSLKRLEVQIVSDRLIDLRLTFEGKAKDEWIDEWTYAGSYTVKWAKPLLEATK